MAKLTNDIARTYELGDIEEFPVLAGEKICEGAAVGIDSNGYARSLQAGDKFGGFADEASDNSSGQDGSRTVRVKYKGTVVITAPSGITQANVGNYLYASDDNTFTTTASNTLIGTIRSFSNNEISIEFEAFIKAVTSGVGG